MRCPICGRKPLEKYRPFCSKRCADEDLGNWLRGQYALPADAPEELEAAASALADHRSRRRKI